MPCSRLHSLLDCAALPVVCLLRASSVCVIISVGRLCSSTSSAPLFHLVQLSLCLLQSALVHPCHCRHSPSGRQAGRQAVLSVTLRPILHQGYQYQAAWPSTRLCGCWSISHRIASHCLVTDAGWPRPPTPAPAGTSARRHTTSSRRAAGAYPARDRGQRSNLTGGAMRYPRAVRPCPRSRCDGWPRAR